MVIQEPMKASHFKSPTSILLKKLVSQLIDTSKKQGLEWAFGKVHKDNLASSTSLIRNGFEKKMKYNKPVKVADIKQLLADKVLSKTATNNIIERLSRISNEEFINVDYDILIKKLCFSPTQHQHIS